MGNDNNRSSSNNHRKKRSRKLKTVDESLYLLTDVLELILKHLDMQSVAQMSTVSKSWNSVAARVLASMRNTPMALVPSVRHYDTRHLVISAANSDAFFKLRLRDFGKYRCSSSACGWLVLTRNKSFSGENKTHSKITLLNPFSSDRIDLPPLERRLASTVVCLASTSKSRDFSVMIRTIQGGNYYWKNGDAKWTELTGFNLGFYRSFVKLKGQLYCINLNGYLYTIQEQPFRIKEVFVTPCNEIRNMMFRFLVEFNGELLIVVSQNLGEFMVYRLDFAKKEWSKVDSIGDHAIFLDLNHHQSFTVSAKKAGCSANSIYYLNMDTGDEAWQVSNLEFPGTTTFFRKSNSPLRVDSSVWIYQV